MEKNDLEKLARLLRYWSLTATTEAGSGHPTSCLSAADLMAVLLGKYFKFDFEKPNKKDNDRLIFSKGHAAPLLYAMFAAAGAITQKDLLTLRKLGSPLQGHPAPVLPWVDVATGSLGQGFSAGVGMALNGKYLDKTQYRVFVLLGDSEMAEGSCWEAAATAAYYQLDNLIGILDVNRLGQSRETMLGHNTAAYEARVKSFGWNTLTIDGHAISEIDRVYQEALQLVGRPTMIIAKTFKGKGISFLEDKEGKHGKALSKEELDAALKELGEVDTSIRAGYQKGLRRAEIAHLRPGLPVQSLEEKKVETAVYEVGKQVATRAAYGDALVMLGNKDDDIVVLDGEVSNSTYSERFAAHFPERYFEMFIAEQHMVATAVGLSKRGKIPFASTFAAFFARTYDQIRMAAVSQANIKLVGSHAGVSIGEDGPSQMGLEDLAMMRAVHSAVVLYPSDAVSTVKLVKLMAKHKGIAYLRTTRAATPVIYDESLKVKIGGSVTVRQSNTDTVCIVAAGITLHEALKAYDMLAGEGTLVRVVDAYSIKPIDAVGIHKAARESGHKIIVAEDHYWAGGLGDAVLNIFAASPGFEVFKMAVTDMPGSGTPQELLHAAGIDAEGIVKKVKEIFQ